jgi:hypothetical protein
LATSENRCILLRSFVDLVVVHKGGDMRTIQSCIEIFGDSSFFTDPDQKRNFAANFLNLYTEKFRKRFGLENVVLKSV